MVGESSVARSSTLFESPFFYWSREYEYFCQLSRWFKTPPRYPWCLSLWQESSCKKNNKTNLSLLFPGMTHGLHPSGWKPLESIWSEEANAGMSVVVLVLWCRKEAAYLCKPMQFNPWLKTLTMDEWWMSRNPSNVAQRLMFLCCMVGKKEFEKVTCKDATDGALHKTHV